MVIFYLLALFIWFVDLLVCLLLSVTFYHSLCESVPGMRPTQDVKLKWVNYMSSINSNRFVIKEEQPFVAFCGTGIHLICSS